MLAVKGRYNGTAVVLDSIPSSVELATPTKEYRAIVNFPDIHFPKDDFKNLSAGNMGVALGLIGCHRACPTLCFLLTVFENCDDKNTYFIKGYK